MTITVELPKEIEERFLAQARAVGISVDSLIRQHIINTAPVVSPDAQLSPEEWEREFDELLDSFPVGNAPIPDHAFSREAIYASDDELK